MTRISLEYQRLMLLERKREFPDISENDILSTFRNNFDMSWKHVTEEQYREIVPMYVFSSIRGHVCRCKRS